MVFQLILENIIAYVDIADVDIVREYLDLSKKKIYDNLCQKYGSIIQL